MYGEKTLQTYRWLIRQSSQVHKTSNGENRIFKVLKFKDGNEADIATRSWMSSTQATDGDFTIHKLAKLDRLKTI